MGFKGAIENVSFQVVDPQRRTILAAGVHVFIRRGISMSLCFPQHCVPCSRSSKVMHEFGSIAAVLSTEPSSYRSLEEFLLSEYGFDSTLGRSDKEGGGPRGSHPSAIHTLVSVVSGTSLDSTMPRKSPSVGLPHGESVYEKHGRSRR
jgi:hypothetical protein